MKTTMKAVLAAMGGSLADDAFAASPDVDRMFDTNCRNPDTIASFDTDGILDAVAEDLDGARDLALAATRDLDAVASAGGYAEVRRMADAVGASQPDVIDTRPLRLDFAAAKPQDVQGTGTAESSPPEPMPERTTVNRHELSIGIGVGIIPNYMGSDNYQVTPGLALRGKLHNFSFSSRGTNLNIDLIRERPGADTDIIFGPAINYRSDRTRKIKDLQVAALGKVDAGIEVGGWLGIRRKHVLFKKGYDTLAARVRVVKEVGGGYGGMMVSPSIDYGLALSHTFFLATAVSADFVGKRFGRHYFDISPAGSAASGLAAYNAAGQKGGLLKINFNLAAVKSLSGGLNNKGLSLVALANFGQLQGRYKDSPIVATAGSKNQRMFGVGLAYTF